MATVEELEAQIEILRRRNDELETRCMQVEAERSAIEARFRVAALEAGSTELPIEGAKSRLQTDFGAALRDLDVELRLHLQHPNCIVDRVAALAMKALRQAEDALTRHRAARTEPETLSAEDQEGVLAIGLCLPALWEEPGMRRQAGSVLNLETSGLIN